MNFWGVFCLRLPSYYQGLGLELCTPRPGRVFIYFALCTSPQAPAPNLLQSASLARIRARLPDVTPSFICLFVYGVCVYVCVPTYGSAIMWGPGNDLQQSVLSYLWVPRSD